jgi:hypothetical protein
MSERYLSTSSLARELDESRTTAWRVCRANPGFAIKFGRGFKVPESHLARVKLGETPEAIAAEVLARREPRAS